MVKALDVAVLLDPKFATRSLQLSEAGTYMWRPVLVPHMTGGLLEPGVVMVKVSVWQLPRWLAAPAAPDQVLELFQDTNEAQDYLMFQLLQLWQSLDHSEQMSQNQGEVDTRQRHSRNKIYISEGIIEIVTLQIVSLQADPRALAVDVKYVRFWEIDPPSHVFSNMQQTPNDEAQFPLAVPLEIFKINFDNQY